MDSKSGPAVSGATECAGISSKQHIATVESMGFKILIVETDSVFCENLAKRLSGKDTHIWIADRMAEVKKIVKRNNIDVVLLSLTSLKTEGLAILKMIKKTRPLTEVITINGSGQVGLSIEGMKLGAFDDFMGPFAIDSLTGRIHDAFVQKRRKEKESPAKPFIRIFMNSTSPDSEKRTEFQENKIQYLTNKGKTNSGEE